MTTKEKTKPKIQSTLVSKWLKTKILLKHPRLSQLIPTTVMYSRESLNTMLNKHKMVYVKPVNGSCGNGVIKVIKYSENKYAYHSGTSPRSFTTFSGLYSALGARKLNRPYLIQQGIHLLKYQERIFDIRIMIQKNEVKKWEVSGYIGRLAHPQKVVTNFHNSGKPLPLETLLSPYLKGDKKKEYIRKLVNTGYEVADAFQKKHPGFKELGLDIGIDTDMKPWIIEVNTQPDAYIFNQLKEKKIFRRVIQLKRINGLLKARKKDAKK